MEFKIQVPVAVPFPVPVPVPVPVLPRKTDHLIQCIIDNNLQKLNKLIASRNVNGLYSSKVWKDDVTLLTAAVICKNEEICSNLLKQSADPNILSENGYAPLHYAGRTSGVPISIVKKLLAAKADPDGTTLSFFTPIQCAANKGNVEIVKVLIEAGASADKHYGHNKGVDRAVENAIHQLSLKSEDFKKEKIFFSFSCDIHQSRKPSKDQAEIFSIYKKHFFQENPFSHLILFEQYFCVYSSRPGKEQYHQNAIKWLKYKENADKYIKGVTERFPSIPQKHCLNPLKCLFAALRISESISSQIFSELVQILTKSLQHFENTPERVNHQMLKILNVMMQEFSEHKLTLNYSVYEKLCKSLMPFTNPSYPCSIGIQVFRVFESIHAFDPQLLVLCGLSSVPESILNAVEVEDEAIWSKLQNLNSLLQHPPGGGDSLFEVTTAPYKGKEKKNNLQESQESGHQDEEEKSFPDAVVTSTDESNASVQQLTLHAENPKRRWLKISHRWRSKLEELANMDISNIYRLGSLTLVLNDTFQIAKGSDGTEVYLGLRDDGTEVAVKRMLKSNYKVLKNEEVFLRLPQLDSPSIVRYVDFAEDDNFGYLILQLCEYTLEEYIKDHLPSDSSERTLVLKKLVGEVLCSLQVLHSKEANVLHRDIKPQNVLIDINGKARLADFGISRQLNLGQTTLRTSIAGTRFWKAKEAIDEDSNRGYKRSSDIQVAGMLVYYILSRGNHPFGKGLFCEVNILQGKYKLDHLDEYVAKDLVEWMINDNPEKRPTVQQALAHPFFWTDERKVEYLKKLGTQKEVEKYRDAGEELLHAVETYTDGKTFSQWKTKFPPELFEKLDGKKKAYPENMLGLLRFIRNLHEHYPDDATNINLMVSFPDLFESVYRFAKEKGWHSRPSLKRFLNSNQQI